MALLKYAESFLEDLEIRQNKGIEDVKELKTCDKKVFMWVQGRYADCLELIV